MKHKSVDFGDKQAGEYADQHISHRDLRFLLKHEKHKKNRNCNAYKQKVIYIAHFLTPLSSIGTIASDTMQVATYKIKRGVLTFKESNTISPTERSARRSAIRL
jgi:hypothetical protein